jgi:tetratricopeptide (TPR) repeat protein
MLLRRAPLPLLLLLALAWPAAAQRPNINQTATLKVRLYFENGRPVQQQLLVRLTDALGNTVSDAYSDTQGRAEFNGLNPGDYRLKVSGLGAEDTTSNTFSIMRGEGLHFETVDVKAKAEAGDASSGAPGGTVSAADLNVPDKAKKEFDKGTAALGRNDLAEAKAHFEKAVQIYPQYAGAYNNLGIVAMKAGDHDAATAAFQQAIHINSHYSRAYINLARLLLPDRKYSEAENMLNLALTTEPLNAEALTLLANVELQTGHYDQAAATAAKAHSVPHDGFAIVHIVAAVADENRHLPQEAAAQYAAYLKEAPDGPAAPRARAALAALETKGP